MEKVVRYEEGSSIAVVLSCGIFVLPRGSFCVLPDRIALNHKNFFLFFDSLEVGSRANWKDTHHFLILQRVAGGLFSARLRKREID